MPLLHCTSPLCNCVSFCTLALLPVHNRAIFLFLAVIVDTPIAVAAGERLANTRAMTVDTCADTTDAFAAL